MRLFAGVALDVELPPGLETELLDTLRAAKMNAIAVRFRSNSSSWIALFPIASVYERGARPAAGAFCRGSARALPSDPIQREWALTEVWAESGFRISRR